MRCDEVRKRLTEEAGRGLPRAVVEHLGGCERCARYASRLEVARDLLRDHHARVLPREGFAERVAAGLPRPAADALGWAAVRLLPATALLLALLAWFVFQASPAGQFVEETSPTDDLLGWVLSENSGGGS